MSDWSALLRMAWAIVAFSFAVMAIAALARNTPISAINGAEADATFRCIIILGLVLLVTRPRTPERV